MDDLHCVYCGKVLGADWVCRKLTADKLPERQTAVEKGYALLLPAHKACVEALPRLPKKEGGVG